MAPPAYAGTQVTVLISDSAPQFYCKELWEGRNTAMELELIKHFYLHLQTTSHTAKDWEHVQKLVTRTNTEIKEGLAYSFEK